MNKSKYRAVIWPCTNIEKLNYGTFNVSLRSAYYFFSWNTILFIAGRFEGWHCILFYWLIKFSNIFSIKFMPLRRRDIPVDKLLDFFLLLLQVRTFIPAAWMAIIRGTKNRWRSVIPGVTTCRESSFTTLCYVFVESSSNSLFPTPWSLGHHTNPTVFAIFPGFRREFTLGRWWDWV